MIDITKKSINLKFFGLFLIYSFFGVFSRVFYIQLGFNKEYLYFLAGLNVTPMIFYLIVCLNKNLYKIKFILYLIICSVLLEFFIKDAFDKCYFALNIGILLSPILIGITFIKKINNWFLK
jgi:hypothetical protein